MSTKTLHKHHIVPKYMGGTDEPSNLVKLTIEEHAEAHKILWEKHGNWQDYLAWQGLLNRIDKEELLRLKSHYTHIGKNKSPEHRQKISDALKGRKLSEETKKKLSESRKGNQNRKGKPMSDELKRLYSLNMTGVKRGPYKKRVI